MPSTMSGVDGKVINVYLTPHLLELIELIGDKTTYDSYSNKRHDDNYLLLCEQLFKIEVRRRLYVISVAFAECLAKNGIQLAHQWNIGRAEAANGKGFV